MGKDPSALMRRFQDITDRACVATGSREAILAILEAQRGLFTIKGHSSPTAKTGDQVRKTWERLVPNFDLTKVEFPPDANLCFREAKASGEKVECSFGEVFEGILPHALIAAYQKAFPSNRALVFPLKAYLNTVASPQDVGYLIFIGRRRAFSPRQAKDMGACAQQAALSVENLLLFEMERHRVEELGAVAAISRAITSTLEPRDVLQRIADSAKALFGADGAALWILREGEFLELEVGIGTAEESYRAGVRLALGEGAPGLAAQEKKAVMVLDAQGDPRVVGEGRRYFQAANISSVLLVPMVVGEQALGALGLDFTSPREFSEEMVEMAQTLADQGAIAIQNARLHEKVQQAATKDLLTGIYNHAEFHARLRAELSKAKRSGTPFSIIIIDMDNFKDVNDTYGHLAGDKVLKEVGSRLLGAVRAYDVVARYGGDEFALILPEASRQEAEKVAKRIAGAIADQPFSLGTDYRHRLTASLGIASYPVDGEDPDALILNGDMELYISRGRALHHPQDRDSTPASPPLS